MSCYSGWTVKHFFNKSTLHHRAKSDVCSKILVSHFCHLHKESLVALELLTFSNDWTCSCSAFALDQAGRKEVIQIHVDPILEHASLSLVLATKS